MLPRARYPVPGAELGRGERLEKPGSLLAIPRRYVADVNAMVGAAQEPEKIRRLGSSLSAQEGRTYFDGSI